MCATTLPHPLRVLIVDSWPDAADTLALLLHTWGFDTRVALDAPSAIDAARAEPPDVVIADVALPGMDGYQLARRLRCQPWMEDAVLVALTGYVQPCHRAWAWEAGFSHFLVKGSDPEELRLLLAALEHYGHSEPSDAGLRWPTPSNAQSARSAGSRCAKP
jgi:CheY-like chemotaxis protein